MLNWLFGRRPVGEFDPAWRRVLESNVWQWSFLSLARRATVEAVVARMVHERHWEGAGGLTVTDEMRVTVSGVAALLTLGLDERPGQPRFAFDRLKTVLLYPTGYREPYKHERTGTILGGIVGGEQPTPEDGTFGEGAQRLGEAWGGGVVVLSWRDVVRTARSRGRGENLVLHELAHHLDGLDGHMDGQPTMPDRASQRAWHGVTDAEYHRLVGQARRAEVALLDHYGATSPAEFFAVATECFFEQPCEMRDDHPELYRVLGAFYRQDPAVWTPPAPQRRSGLSGPAPQRRRGGRRAGGAGSRPDYSHLGLSEDDRAFAEGLRLLEEGEFEAAARSLTRTLEGHPEDAEAMALRAAALLELGDVAGAARDAARAADLDPDDVEARLTLADALLELGDAAHAQRQVRRVLATTANLPYAWFLEGLLAEQAGDAKRAKKAYGRVVALDPFDAEAHLGLADALERLGDSAKARFHRERASQLDPLLE
ncbi:MAG: zinc-dependent peptidase [Lacipirellulaceae bacterium]